MRSSNEFEANRRDFIHRATVLSAASLLGLPGMAAAEPPPETTRFRIAHGPFICYAPQFLAEEFLRMEGFTEIEYVPVPPDATYVSAVSDGKVDLAIIGPSSAVAAIDQGRPIVMLTGVHVGCWELFANDHVNSVRDLKGKSIAVTGIGGVDHLWIASILGYVGIDPVKSVNWVPTKKLSESMRLYLEGKVDAFLAFPPQPQELHRKKIGHVIINTILDRPWSQYFCCMAGMPREFVAKYPVATKRALRALLKAADVCANEPERAARYLEEKGYETRYDIGLEVMKSLPYNHWRDWNPEDTLRFFALRLHEVGIIKTAPNQLIARGTDWRFLNELKKELKA
jgi:NitT/TauT family transport system substrate-binding protein